jgi:hypothetical protein
VIWEIIHFRNLITSPFQYLFSSYTMKRFEIGFLWTSYSICLQLIFLSKNKSRKRLLPQTRLVLWWGDSVWFTYLKGTKQKEKNIKRHLIQICTSWKDHHQGLIISHLRVNIFYCFRGDDERRPDLRKVGLITCTFTKPATSSLISIVQNITEYKIV